MKFRSRDIHILSRDIHNTAAYFNFRVLTGPIQHQYDDSSLPSPHQTPRSQPFTSWPHWYISTYNTLKVKCIIGIHVDIYTHVPAGSLYGVVQVFSSPIVVRCERISQYSN